MVGYDHRGHGRSPGPRGVIVAPDDFLHDLASAVDATRAAFPDAPLLLVGHSLGGAMAARFVAERVGPAEAAPWSRPVDALVLSSPALAIALRKLQVTLLKTVGRWWPDLAVANGLKPEWICNDPRTVARYRADPLVHDRTSGRLAHFILDAGRHVASRAAAWRTPTLVLWSGQDRCVDPSGSAAFVERAPPDCVSAQVFPAMAHEIFNELGQEAVFLALSQWLRRLALRG